MKNLIISKKILKYFNIDKLIDKMKNTYLHIYISSKYLVIYK